MDKIKTNPVIKFIAITLLVFSIGALLAVRILTVTLFKRVNMFEGSATQQASKAFEKKIGSSVRALSLTIEKDSATLFAQDPHNPQNVDKYEYVRGLVVGPTPYQLNIVERNLDKTLFDLNEVNIEATAQVVKDALEKTRLEGGKIEKIEIERGPSWKRNGYDYDQSGKVRWMIYVAGARESASVFAKANGEIRGADLSQTQRAVNFNLYKDGAMREAVSEIKKAFSGKVELLELRVSSKDIALKARDPKKPDEYNSYVYNVNGLTATRPIIGGELEILLFVNAGSIGKIKPEDLLFNIDDVNLELAPEIEKTALSRVNIDNGKVSSIKIARYVHLPGDEDSSINWAVDVTNDREKSGYAVFDAKGGFLQVKE